MIFNPTCSTQKYCGSKTQKTGCSYRHKIERTEQYNSTTYAEYMHEYQREWRKKQRKLNTLYAQRQRKAKAIYRTTEQGKLIIALSRKRNMKTILLCNRRRELKERGIIGNHTLKEWESLKGEYHYTCAICGIPEPFLKALYEDKRYHNLTRDHIVPLSKGGTDYIDNIQPLCMTCNARKSDKGKREVMQMKKVATRL